MRLIELTVRNFRGFGPNIPPIDLNADLVLLFGPNGHGKTSLAEAIEWLFYGTTKRRQRGEEFSRAEYAGTFANVHGHTPTEVSLKIRFHGRDIILSRRLGDRETSTTLVDGQPADFNSVGILPQEAYYPVVAQHGLQTFVHSKPKDRRDAICAALGLDELTSLKSSLESARSCGLLGFSNRVRRDSRLLLGRRLWASWIGLCSGARRGGGIWGRSSGGRARAGRPR